MIVYIIAVLALGALVFVSNRRIDITAYRVALSGLPEGMSGYRIVQISDLHNAVFGKGQRRLIDLVEKADPDVCVLTGDLIGSRTHMPDATLELIHALTPKFRVLFITGNHEWQHKDPNRLISQIEKAGAEYLDSKTMIHASDGSGLPLYGIDDARSYGLDEPDPDSRFEATLHEVARDHRAEYGDESPILLLSHRPKYADAYARAGFDLVFAGHVHGGVWRLPGKIGVFDPERRFFPRYSGGLYTVGGTKLVVSRGLGRATIPFRINNSPELVVVELIPG